MKSEKIFDFVNYNRSVYFFLKNPFDGSTLSNSNSYKGKI